MSKNSVTENSIESFINRRPKLAFDSNVLIGLIEEKDYSRQARIFFEFLAQRTNEVWTSVLTIPEVLIKPTKEMDAEMVTDYQHVLFDSPFSFAEIKKPTASQAVNFGGRYNLKSGDALILASVLDAGVTGFITADDDFQSVKELEVFLVK